MDSSQEAFSKTQSQAPLGRSGQPAAVVARRKTTDKPHSHQELAMLPFVSTFFTTVINRKLAMSIYLSTDRSQALAYN